MITTEAANIIRSAAALQSIMTVAELGRRTGIPANSLQKKLSGINRFYPHELAAIYRVCRMTDSDILLIAKGGFR